MKKLTIYQVIGLSLIATSLFLFCSYVKQNGIFTPDSNRNTMFIDATQEPTTPGKFAEGEILLPDYSHNDTLIVTDANKLNDMFAIPATAPATDGEISNALATTTVKF